LILIFGIKFFTMCLVRVDSGEAAVLIKKTGKDLPTGDIAAPDETYKGMQETVLTEGWHLLNPYTWDYVVVQQVDIPKDKVGIKIRNFGKPMEPGRVIAKEGEKGIQAEILKTGRYPLNTYLYSVEIQNPTQIAGNHVGVVNLLDGKDPENPNVFVVKTGERGTQPNTISAGSHYINPYEKWIFPMPLESHRFNLTGEGAIEFPSKDGFPIRMEAVIEWAVDPARAAEVFVKYVDSRAYNAGSKSDEMVKLCIEETVILPYARAFSRIEGSKHIAKELIDKKTRDQLQKEVFEGLTDTSGSQGIQIRSVNILSAAPPEAITKPINERELAIRLRETYEQQIEREKREKDLAKEKKLQERLQQMKKTEADVSVQITQATREKEVAVIEASRRLDVAKKELEAAKNQAAAIMSKGKAEADVIAYQNTAEASGIRVARNAFGDGESYVRYLFQEKVGPSIKYVLTNTDGPIVDIFRQFQRPGAVK
ncbi:MAG: SPFH domain-containing protein, partial [Planctomycetota bacterium]